MRQRDALLSVVVYCWESERADYITWREENPEQDPDQHIFTDLEILAEALKVSAT